MIVPSPREVAELLEARNPGWRVTWDPSRQRFTASPEWATVEAATAGQLQAAMQVMDTRQG